MSNQEIPFGKIRDGKIILSGWGEYPEREIGEVRDQDPDASITYFKDRFEQLKSKVEELENEIDSSQNKGSFLMKLLHIKDQLSSHDGLGDYNALQDRLALRESELNDTIKKNRERNSEIKKSLLEEVQAAADKINWKEATVEIHDIKNRWIKTGNAKDEDHEKLDEVFWGIIEGFFEKKRQFYEDKKRLGDLRKKEYEELITRTAELNNLTGNARRELSKSLEDQWKDVGSIPKEEYIPLLKIFNSKIKERRSPRAEINLADLSKELDSYLDGSKPYHFKEIDDLKGSLRNVRADKLEDRKLKSEVFNKIQLLIERDFLDKLASKRFKNFRELDKTKKKNIRLGILEELIGRDKADLEKYQENSANFSSESGSMLDLVEKKIRNQKSKIRTKEILLKLLKSD